MRYGKHPKSNGRKQGDQAGGEGCRVSIPSPSACMDGGFEVMQWFWKQPFRRWRSLLRTVITLPVAMFHVECLTARCGSQEKS